MINAQKGYDSEALQTASAEGNEKLVQVLLDQGAEVNAQGGHFGNALQAASIKGHKKVVQVLLDRGVEINIKGGVFDNALQATSLNGHEEVVRLLLEGGADINAQGGHFGNALQAASLNGHEKVVRLLLEGGADTNAQGGHFGNALQAASLNGHKEVVRLLLEGGADTNAQGGHFGNALQAASLNGHEKVVQLLLDQAADVNAQGGDYNNALQAASYASPAIIALTGSAEAGIGPTTLRATIDQGYVSPVQKILDGSFDTVALADFEWLRDLQELGYASEEIAELLVFERYHSPWICFEPSLAPEGTISIDLHQPNCVHREQAQNLIAPDEIRYNDGIEAVDPTRSKLSSSAEDDITYLIEKLCGLAGILPTIRRDQLGRSVFIDSREPIITFGQVVFTTDKKPLIASVTYCPTERTVLARQRQDEEILSLGLKIPPGR